MKKLAVLMALPILALAQGTNPTIQTWVKASPGGYPVDTIGQFDKSVWIPSRQVYAHWGEYKLNQFSEQNDALGFLSYAENRWHLASQAASEHGSSYLLGGHQWGFMTVDPAEDAMWIIANSGAQALEPYFLLWKYDMGAMSVNEFPLMTNSGVIQRQFVSNGSTLSGYMEWDSTHNRFIIFPDSAIQSTNLTICDKSAMTCIQYTVGSGPPATQATSNLRFDPDDGLTYWWGGGSVAGSGGESFPWRVNAGATPPVWQHMTSTDCTGGDCVGGAHPPARSGAGFAYSTVDHKWLLVGGIVNPSTRIVDTWTFDPAGNSGNGHWEEICGPGAVSCGTPTTTYPNFTTAREGDRLVYDSTDNVFIIVDDNSQAYYYALSAATGNYGRSSGSYAPPQPTAPIVGPLNRNTITATPPPTTPSTSTNQTEAFSLSVDSSAGTVYISHVEPTVASDNSSAYYIPTPYIWNSATGYMPTGTQLVGGAAINPGQGGVQHPSGHVYHVRIGSNEYEAHERRNFGGQSTLGKSVFQQYNSGTGVWNSITYEIPCYTNLAGTGCGPSGADRPRNYPAALVNANGVPTVAMVEIVDSFNPYTSLFVAQWNGTAMVSLTGSTALNILSSSLVGYASADSDASGNVGVCWAEEQSNNTNRIIMTVTPQIRCKLWNGSSFSVLGPASLNQSSTAWARTVSIRADGLGHWLVAWEEESATGPAKLYVKSCSGGSCTLLGGGALNINASTGFARHPSLTMDGSTPILAWEEKSAQGQHFLGYIKRWNGTSWVTVISGLAADATNGSIAEIGITSPTTGTVTAAWAEETWGNLHQIYSASYSDGVLPTCVITGLPIASGLIGQLYSQSVGTSNCASPAFTISAGSLPPGLTMSGGGLVSGYPTTAGVSSFTVAVTDANGNPTAPLSITINTPSLFSALTVQETLFPGGITGIARTNEPVCVGVPVPDSLAVTSTSAFNLIGASAGQFRTLGNWPASGNIQWVKACAIVPSVSAGGTATMTLTNAGVGNFGGSDLATDNGTTITVATGAATFTIKKAHFNGLDIVDVGLTHVVLTGASTGLVLYGPNPTATYPANVTCLPTTGGSACTTLFTSANDASSTCIIEENGPVLAVIKCDGNHDDGSGHTYMKFTARLSFYKGETYTKFTSIMRNADYGTSNTATVAYKGHQGYELRLTPNIAGTLNYTFANHTGTPTTGTVSGTDVAYIYQAESTYLNKTGWCSTSGCVTPSPLSGYAILKNGSALLTGTASQPSQGWADISDSGGVGIEIGQFYLAAYGNKSLEFRGGGSDVRVGIWAQENNTTSTSTTTANVPYYATWPQYSINDVYLDFHATTPASLPNDFLKFQSYLAARATPSYYNSTGALPYPLTTAAEEDAYYSTAISSASPTVPNYTAQDLGTVEPNEHFLPAWRFKTWNATGAGNQMEFAYSSLTNFWRRGFGGDYLFSAFFYKLVAEQSFPRSDGFTWASKSAGETQYFSDPTALRANITLGMNNRIELGHEHAWWMGMIHYYWATGDETIKDAINDGVKDWYSNTVSTNNLINNAKLVNARAVGTVFIAQSRLNQFFNSTGDTTGATAMLSRGENLWANQLKPILCVSGFPAGCTFQQTGGNAVGTQGTSLTRGIEYAFDDTSIDQTGCSFTDDRTDTAFFVGALSMGMWEFRGVESPAWADYIQFWDYAYGFTQAEFGEMYADNLSPTSWIGNGFRYKQALDFANACATVDFTVKNPNAFWPIWYASYQYLGQGVTGWQRTFQQSLQWALSIGCCNRDEMYGYTVANNIYLVNHPNPNALLTQSITGFVDNGPVGGGLESYTISWTVPPNVSSYRAKWGTKTLVEYIGYNSGTATFVGSPTTTQNWFASTEITGLPSPGTPGTTQSATVSVPQTGLSSGNFMLKAQATGVVGNGGTNYSGKITVSGAIRR